MARDKARSSQLIVIDDTLYHIHLKKADNIPPNILLMGAAGRVDKVASHFEEVTFQSRNPERPEFYTVAGMYKRVPVAAMSTGIGVGPTDITINELHALFECDLETGALIAGPRQRVNIIRLGTSGTCIPDIPAGALAISEFAVGLDNISAFYPPVGQNSVAEYIESEFAKTLLGKMNNHQYCSEAHPSAVGALYESAVALGEPADNIVTGITASSSGFFGPEGRRIGRLRTVMSPEEFAKDIQEFKVKRIVGEDHLRIVNHEMESSVLFRLGYEQLGYRVGTVCLIVDNIATDDVLAKDEATERMNICTRVALDSLVRLSAR